MHNRDPICVFSFFAFYDYSHMPSCHTVTLFTLITHFQVCEAAVKVKVTLKQPATLNKSLYFSL